MAKRLVLSVEPRKLLGRKVKQLRKEGFLPANIYGKTIKSQAVQVDSTAFQNVFLKAGSTQLVDIQVKGTQAAKPVLIHQVQLDPITDAPIHAELYQVDLKQKVTAQIPIVLKGEAPAVEQGGVLVQILDEVEVEALPTDLPEKFEVDISGLKAIGDLVTAEALAVEAAKVTLQLENPKAVVVQIEEPAPEEEEAPPPAPAEGEAAAAEAEGEKAEGETGEPKTGKEDQEPKAAAKGEDKTEAKPA